MGQPVLTAILGLAMAFTFTAAIAIVTLAAKTRSRAIKLSVVGAIIALAVVTLQRADLRINFTGSMPIGVYVLTPISPGGVKRSMLVAACPPTRAAEIGRIRGYLGIGPCPHQTELLLKFIAAVAGDTIDVTASGVTVNGCQLRRSLPVKRDHSGRRLVHWPRGRFRLRRDEVWLYADNDRSWDSRYWGAASISNIAGIAHPVTTASLLTGSCFRRRVRLCSLRPNLTVIRTTCRYGRH